MSCISFHGRILAGVLLLAAAAGCTQKTDPAVPGSVMPLKLANIYGDNMVFQQQMPIVVKGKYVPGGDVRVELNGKKAATQADANGEWMLKLPPMTAGGPYELKVQGKDLLVLKNVMVGEVWVCSGQSNMEWPLIKSDRGEAEAAAANYPDIRLFQVKRNPSPVNPQPDVPGSWSVCSPATVKSFSGVGYFFGRKLYEDFKVPVGLINSSVGGTRVEAWMPLESFERNPDFASLARESRTMPASLDAKQQMQKFKEDLTKWLSEREAAHKDEVAKAAKYGAATAAETATWKTMELPGSWQMDIDGVVWFSKAVEVPAAWAGKDLTLTLGRVDDCDMTWFNGEKVGQTWTDVANHWSLDRSYTVPGKLVKAGTNMINVRVFDHAYDGGICGPTMTLGLKGDAAAKINLAGDWKYTVEFAIDYKKEKKRPEPVSAAGNNYASTLYNGMIHGITFFPVRGAIWYQGEANAGSGNYDKTFPAMIQSWRDAWKNPDMGFFFVQLAAFERHTPKVPLPADFFARQQPGNPPWARTREAQEAALKMKNTGMAVAIDIGNPIDIHPTNKQDVGHRLALSAEKVMYGKEQVCSGPTYDRMTVDNGAVRLHFKSIGSGLMAKNGELKQFAIAGADRKFHWATAKIDGDTVVVSSPEVKEPVAVRYAWSAYPEGCNLFNRENLPAGPFRTDRW